MNIKRLFVAGIGLCGLACWYFADSKPVYGRPTTMHLDIPVDEFRLQLNGRTCVEEASPPVFMINEEIQVTGSFRYLANQPAPTVLHLRMMIADQETGKLKQLRSCLIRDLRQRGPMVSFKGALTAPPKIGTPTVVIADQHLRLGLGYVNFETQ